MSARSLLRRSTGGLRRRRLIFECFEARRLLTADLWGIVWNDASGDGHRQDGEAPLPEWRVFLDHNANGHWDDGERSALTNDQGRYHFGDVEPGEHLVTLAARDGWTATAPEGGVHVVYVEAGDVNDDLHFGVRSVEDAGQIAGVVWNDLDGDGQRDDGEPPLADWPVYLDSGDVWIQENVQIWPLPPVHVAFTDADGGYRFEEVFPGAHMVTVELGDGWRATSPVSGSYQVTLEANQVLDGLVFGLEAPEVGQIGGVVWSDLDGDGQRDDGEPPLADWPVYLDDYPVGILESGDLDPSTGVAWTDYVVLTDDSGAYRFEQVRVGDHVVTVGLNEGWTPTTPVNGAYEVSVAANQVVEGLDFGLLAPEVGQITGSLWNDLDGDGQRDEGEPPLADWPVYLDGYFWYDDPGILDANAPQILPILVAYTNEDGVYRFEEVIVGDHVVVPGPGDGWTVTSPESGVHEIHLEADQVIEGLDFGLKAPEFGQLTGSVWNDLDGDGQRDDGEPPLVDWAVYLDGGAYWLDGAGVLDPNTPGQFRSNVAYTDGEGRYRFEQVIVGDRVVAPDLGDGWMVTAPEIGFHEVHLEADQVIEGLDFGLKSPEFGQLAGSVWNDLDGDGQRDDGEPPLAHWPIYLDGGDMFADPGNSPIVPPGYFAVTDEQGAFHFEHVLAGEHTVKVGESDGWKVTAPAEGVYHVTVDADETIGGLDFGLVATSAWILGSVWNDLDGDGAWDQEEPPLSEWLVYLDENGNSQHDDGEPHVLTSSHGGYALHVTPGDHRVAVSLPDAWVATSPADGVQVATVEGGQVVDSVRFGAQLVVTLNSPYAGSDHDVTPQDVPVEIDVLANDHPGPGGAWNPETLAIVQGPQHGSVHLSLPLGVITYVPQPGFFGRDVFVYTVANTEGAVSNPAEVEIEVGVREYPWQNPRMRWDVDDSGQVSIMDALAEVTELREGGARLLPMPDAIFAGEAEVAGAAPSVHHFYDVNGDNKISVGDLLDVIFHIRDANLAAASEAADSPAMSAVFATSGPADENEPRVELQSPSEIEPVIVEEDNDQIGCSADNVPASLFGTDDADESLETVLEAIAADVLLAS